MRTVQTCGACPEQYDVFADDGRQIGYLRLRHGYFAAYWPNADSDDPVYSANTIGDGVFDPSERDLHMARALAAIAEREGQR